MSPTVFACVMFAAGLHASWNAVLRGGGDRQSSMTLMMLAICAVTATAMPFVALPNLASMPYILASAIIHVGYNLALISTYRQGDLGASYAIARGSSPVLVLLGAAVVAQEHIGLFNVVGVGLVSIGIMSLALDGTGDSRVPLVPALITGALIGLYTVVDGVGVRMSVSSLTYTVWMFFIWSLIWCGLFGFRLVAYARSERGYTWRQTVTALGGGGVSVCAYGIVIWAMQFGAMGLVSALRETSVLFAVMIGKVFLGERLSVRCIISAGVIVCGVVILVQ